MKTTQHLFDSLNESPLEIKAEERRVSEIRRQRLENNAKRQSKSKEITLQIDPTHQTAHIDMGQDPPEIIISGRRFPQPETNFESVHWDWLSQRVLTLHESFHSRYTDHSDYKYRLAQLDVSLPDRLIHDIYNALEDVSIEEIARSKYPNISILILYFRANLFSNQSIGKTDERGTVVSLSEALITAILDKGTFDSGTLRTLLDSTNPQLHFQSESDRQTFIEFLPKIEDIISVVLNEPVGMRRNRRIFEFIETVDTLFENQQTEDYTSSELAGSPGGFPDDATGDSGESLEDAPELDGTISDPLTEQSKSENTTQQKQKKTAQIGNEGNRNKEQSNKTENNEQQETSQLQKKETKKTSNTQSQSTAKNSPENSEDGSSVDDTEDNGGGRSKVNRTTVQDDKQNEKISSGEMENEINNSRNSNNSPPKKSELESASDFQKEDEESKSDGNQNKKSVRPSIEQELKDDIIREDKEAAYQETKTKIDEKEELHSIERAIRNAGYELDDEIFDVVQDYPVREEIWEEAYMNGQSLSLDLENLMPTEETGWKRNVEDGMLDGASISRAILGHSDVYMNKESPEKTIVNLVIAIDKSASMRRYIDVAEFAYGMFASAMDSVNSSRVQINILAVELRKNRVKIAVPFGQSIEENAGKIVNGKTAGGTPLEHLLNFSNSFLMSEKGDDELNLLSIITDDKPGDMKKYTKALNRSSFPVIGLIIGREKAEFEEYYDETRPLGKTKESVSTGIESFAREIGDQIRTINDQHC